MTTSATDPTSTATTTDGRLARGERTRRAVLERACEIASVDGLDGLTIGRLAADLGASKAGVFVHFGSKEELQLAAIKAAADGYTRHVVEPARERPEGLAQVVDLTTRWLTYVRTKGMPGGCFFFSVSAEYDAKPGRVRDVLAENRRRWLALFEDALAAARRQGQVAPSVDPAALAFEIDALGMAANLHAQLCDDPSVFDRVLTAVHDRLRAVATDPSTIPDQRGRA
jgi:AcrR family transcriptional regulator